jgi:hypothetical protein
MTAAITRHSHDRFGHGCASAQVDGAPRASLLAIRPMGRLDGADPVVVKMRLPLAELKAKSRSLPRCSQIGRQRISPRGIPSPTVSLSRRFFWVAGYRWSTSGYHGAGSGTCDRGVPVHKAADRCAYSAIKRKCSRLRVLIDPMFVSSLGTDGHSHFTGSDAKPFIETPMLSA